MRQPFPSVHPGHLRPGSRVGPGQRGGPDHAQDDGARAGVGHRRHRPHRRIRAIPGQVADGGGRPEEPPGVHVRVFLGGGLPSYESTKKSYSRGPAFPQLGAREEVSGKVGT